MAYIEIDDEKLRAIATDAMFAQLTQDQKDRLIQGAIEHLVSKESPTAKWTNMQSILNHAVRGMTEKLFEQELNNGERKAQVAKMVTESLDKLFQDADRRSKLVDKLSQAIGDSLFGSRY